ncbi:hypothetical protein [Erythrobacter sp. MTPC3]|uniref:hypothetical protein n=1 Tax=Erythrobacter sp. MTPC3 TaxID=3056564 RepID=UPI0036F3B0BD
MTTHFTELAQRAAADGVISPEELLGLRRQGWGDGLMTREEAEAIFAVNNALNERSDDWCDFMVEAVGEYVLNGTQPRGQCDAEEANWLIKQVDHDGIVESKAELETLVAIVEKAQNVPDTLKNYVLAQVEKEVLTGTGPTRCGGELSSNHISAAEVRILRRVIFASGGHGPAAVSRFDAEMLFRLKDATLAEDNAPEWDDLFLDGVANFLKGFMHTGAQISHDRAVELEKFVADNTVNVGGFMARAAREAPQVANHLGKVFGKRTDAPGFTEKAAAGEVITDFEQDWLEKMVDADGEVDELERRLIARIIDEG